MNHYGQPDVAMFDFTCMYASEHAAMVYQRHGHQLLVCLVGDSLLEVSHADREKCVWRYLCKQQRFYYVLFFPSAFLANGYWYSPRFSSSAGLSLDDSQLGKRRRSSRRPCCEVNKPAWIHTWAICCHVVILYIVCVSVCVRESLYRVLTQTTPENMQKNISLYTVDPTTRYANFNTLLITPAQVHTAEMLLKVATLLVIALGRDKRFNCLSL